MVLQVSQKLAVSERRAGRVLEQARATQRRALSPPSDEKPLTDDIVALVPRYGRYGYRRITALLNDEQGWSVHHKRVERIWRKEGLRVPKKQPKRARLWLNDGSCLRLRPEHIRSDNGPEFTVGSIRKRLNRLGVKTLFIEPGSPWENGDIESFHGKLRDELLNREIFTILEEAKVLIEQWRKEYNLVRQHSALGYQPPAPEAISATAMT